MRQTIKGGYSSLYGIKDKKLFLITNYKDDYTFKFGVETLLSFKHYIKNQETQDEIIEDLREFFPVYDELSSDDKVILNFTTSYCFKNNEIENLVRVLVNTIELIEDYQYTKVAKEIITSLINIKNKYDYIVWKDSSFNCGVIEMADNNNNIIDEVFEYYEKENEYSNIKYQ